MVVLFCLPLALGDANLGVSVGKGWRDKEVADINWINTRSGVVESEGSWHHYVPQEAIVWVFWAGELEKRVNEVLFHLV